MGIADTWYHTLGWSSFSKQHNQIPKPPPLPDYDVQEEQPTYWTWHRMFNPLNPVDRSSWPKIGDQPESDDKPDWRGVVKNNIIPMPLPGLYNDPQRHVKGYFWFDTPDYADPFKKLWYAAKFFLNVGTGLAIGVLALEGKDFSRKYIYGLLKRTTIPCFSHGMVAASLVITLANLRGMKDDRTNYGVAGFLTACWAGRLSYIIWARHIIFWPAAAMTVKHNAEVNGQLMPIPDLRQVSYGFHGANTEQGIMSGDLTFGVGMREPDPGRANRSFPI